MLQPPLLEKPPFHALLSPSYSAPGICQLGPSPLARPPFVASVKAFCLPPFLPPPLRPSLSSLLLPLLAFSGKLNCVQTFPPQRIGEGLAAEERGGEKGNPRK